MDIIQAEYALASVLNDVISIVRMRVMDRPLLFVTNIDANLPGKLLGDEVRVRQVVLNLLSNAVKYTPSGHIALSAEGERRDDGTVLLTFRISDTGVGIVADNIDKIFDDFSRVDNKNTRNVAGTGLGLSITRNLTRSMGGDVVVSSAYEQGSTFTATLIQKTVDDRPFAAVNEPAGKSVLLFDNRDICARSVVRTCANLGVPCTAVADKTDFEYEVALGVHSHILVSTLLFEAARRAVKNAAGALVLLAEYGETVLEPNARVISMPVHAISLANILNGLEDGEYSYHHSTVVGINYTAPTARILIVDDIRTNLRVAEGLLLPLGAKLDTCLSGEEALGLVREHEYDIIFMDHMMPDMDGLEAAGYIRAMDGERFKTVPIVALTANAISGMKEMFLANGFNDYLAKPIETNKLYELLNRWIPKTKRSSAAPPAAKPAADPRTAAFSIDRVDTAQGVRLSGGSFDRYIKVLEFFVTDTNERMPLLEDVPEDDNLRLFCTTVHALKTASKIIGAPRVSDQAYALEMASKAGDIAAIAADLPKFREDLKDLARRVADALARFHLGDTFGTEPIPAELLGELRAALSITDLENIDRLLGVLSANKNLDEIATKTIAALSDDVLISDFDGAITRLDAYLDA